MTRNPHITVLGGGPAGLAAGAAATGSGLEAVVLEAADRVGGNCRTISIDGFRFDTGAHRIHDKAPEVTAWFADRLGDRMHQVTATSRIWDDGRLLPFPIASKDLVRHLGLGGCAAAAADLVYRRLKLRGRPGSFHEFALASYGRPVASRFLLDYSEKLWGAPSHRLSPSVAGKRLSGLDLRTFINDSLGRRTNSSRHVEGRFFYPRGGIGGVPATLAEACGRDRIRTRTRIETLEHDDRRVTAVRTDGGERLPIEEVVCSLPLSLTVSLLEPHPPDSVVDVARALRFRQVILVALFLDRPSVTGAATVYFPSARFPFTRVCEPRNRCPTMAPEGKTSLVIELPCFTNDGIWRASDEAIIDLVLRHLAETEWYGEGEILGGAVRRLSNAYPVLETGCEQRVAEIEAYLDRFTNLHMVGRGGTFTYGWIHDMVRAGRETVAAIAGER
jgi:protoporphyrinogen oxidase